MNWNYEELGFRSQKEMEESIERVKAAKANPKNELELRAENRAKFDAMNKNDGIDFKGLYEGARLEELDRAVASKLYREKERTIQEAEDKELTDLLSKASDKIAQDKKLKADREIAEAKAKANRDIEAALYKKNGVRVETEIEKSLKSLIGGLNLNEAE